MLTLYRPFGDLLRDDFFARGLGKPWAGGQPESNQGFMPAVDVVETDNAYVITAELAGVKPEQIEVEVKEGVLTLRGERSDEREEKKEGYRRVERSFGRFERAFTLPKGVTADALKATTAEGVLTVTVPKPEPVTAHKVHVQGEGLVDKAKCVVAKAV